MAGAYEVASCSLYFSNHPWTYAPSPKSLQHKLVPFLATPNLALTVPPKRKSEMREAYNVRPIFSNLSWLALSRWIRVNNPVVEVMGISGGIFMSLEICSLICLTHHVKICNLMWTPLFFFVGCGKTCKVFKYTDPRHWSKLTYKNETESTRECLSILIL